METKSEPSFLGFLRVLGFSGQDVDGASKSMLAPDLFQLPNREAFQKIIYFLFDVLDSEKSISDFRDCWPILDKKQEAEFRRKTFNWYKDLQVENPDKLPQITASLFQSPGGRKFLNFITCFVRFVVTQKLKKCDKPPPFLDTNFKSKSSRQLAKQVLPKLIEKNNSSTQEYYSKLLTHQTKGQELVDKMSNDFRGMKSRLRMVTESNQTLIQSSGIQFDSSAESCNQMIQVVNQELEKQQKATQELREKFDQSEKQFTKSLDLIDSIVCSESNDDHQLNLTELSSYKESSNLPSLMEKLLDHVTSTHRELSSMTPGQAIPIENVQRAVDVVTRQRDKSVMLQHQLEREVAPSLVSTIANLRAELSGVDWAEAFGHKSSSSSGNDSQPFVIPPSPGVNFETVTQAEAAAPSFLLQTTKGHEVSKEKVYLTPVRDEKAHVQNKSLGSRFLRGQIPRKLSTNNDVGSSNDLSDHFNDPTRSHFLIQSKAGSVKSIDESKFSVFSPILSSSRFDPSIVVPQSNPRAKDEIVLNVSHSFLLSDPTVMTNPTFKSPPKSQALNRLLNEQAEFSDEVQLKVPSFHLSPRFFEEFDCDGLKDDVAENKFDAAIDNCEIGAVKNKLEVANSKGDHTRRRDSGLIKFKTRVGRLSMGGDASPTEKDRRMQTRLNDLIATLSFSPSETLLSNESIMQMSDLVE